MSEDSYDWKDATCTVIHQQDAIAVYLNPNDQVVIRQHGWPDEDNRVVISKECLEALIDRLVNIRA
jgi:hypothetical protein